MSKVIVEMERACLQECDELRTELAEAGAEITALRAALDQERADNERLREYAQHTGAWCGQNMGHACTCGLDALLSGRGNGSETK